MKDEYLEPGYTFALGGSWRLPTALKTKPLMGVRRKVVEFVDQLLPAGQWMRVDGVKQLVYEDGRELRRRAGVLYMLGCWISGVEPFNPLALQILADDIRSGKLKLQKMLDKKEEEGIRAAFSPIPSPTKGGKSIVKET